VLHNNAVVFLRTCETEHNTCEKAGNRSVFQQELAEIEEVSPEMAKTGNFTPPSPSAFRI
jgi:hypothetical protein